MRIKARLRQHRRDFRAIYQCEFCGHEKEDTGYDDHYFHSQVIPNMVCPKCEKASGQQTSEPVIPQGIQL